MLPLTDSEPELHAIRYMSQKVALPPLDMPAAARLLWVRRKLSRPPRASHPRPSVLLRIGGGRVSGDAQLAVRVSLRGGVLKRQSFSADAVQGNAIKFDVKTPPGGGPSPGDQGCDDLWSALWSPRLPTGGYSHLHIHNWLSLNPIMRKKKPEWNHIEQNVTKHQKCIPKVTLHWQIYTGHELTSRFLHPNAMKWNKEPFDRQ